MSVQHLGGQCGIGGIMRLRFHCDKFVLQISGLLLLFIFLLESGAKAAPASTKASTSRRTREQSIREIPYKHLTPEARNRISAVVNRPSMFRRMPLSEIECDQEMYRLMIRKPEIVVNVWQLMGITKVTAKRIAPYLLDTSDGIGTSSKVELVYGTNDTHLFYCDGNYNGPLFRKPLKGKCVLLLKNHYHERNGKKLVSSRLDVFLQLDHFGADALTKTLHPLVGKSADVNFTETMKFLQRMSRTAAKNGPGMKTLAGRLTQVDAATRDDLGKIASRVFQENRARLSKAKKIAAAKKR